MMTNLPAIEGALSSGKHAIFLITMDRATRYQYLPFDSLINLEF